jgi:hypothetical protein
MNSDFALLILSCDKYSDAWEPFFSLFRKFWPECPYKVYLATNELKPEYSGVQIIASGAPKNWSDDTLAVLQQIPEKYVIVLLEDYFLNNKPDILWLQKCLSIMHSENAAFLRLASFRKDHFDMYAFDVIQQHPDFGVTRKSAPFLINLQAGIWNREKLISYIKPGESPWDFETKGSKRCAHTNDVFLGITKTSSKDIISSPIPYLCTAITKGVWMREAIELCKQNNVAINLEHRPVESSTSYLSRKLKHAFPYNSRKYLDYISKRIK